MDTAGEFWQTLVPLEKGMTSHLSILPDKPMNNNRYGKKIWPRRGVPQVSKYPIYY